MVMPVQRWRGLRGYNPSVRHLPWPSDVTEAQKEQWKMDYDAECKSEKAVKLSYVPASKPPSAPPMRDIMKESDDELLRAFYLYAEIADWYDRYGEKFAIDDVYFELRRRGYGISI